MNDKRASSIASRLSSSYYSSPAPKSSTGTTPDRSVKGTNPRLPITLLGKVSGTAPPSQGSFDVLVCFRHSHPPLPLSGSFEPVALSGDFRTLPSLDVLPGAAKLTC